MIYGCECSVGLGTEHEQMITAYAPQITVMIVLGKVEKIFGAVTVPIMYGALHKHAVGIGIKPVQRSPEIGDPEMIIPAILHYLTKRNIKPYGTVHLESILVLLIAIDATAIGGHEYFSGTGLAETAHISGLSLTVDDVVILDPIAYAVVTTQLAILIDPHIAIGRDMERIDGPRPYAYLIEGRYPVIALVESPHALIGSHEYPAYAVLGDTVDIIGIAGMKDGHMISVVATQTVGGAVPHIPLAVTEYTPQTSLGQLIHGGND